LLDLTIAVLAHRHGRGPDFVHDSHLSTALTTGRQLAAALSLAYDVARDEGLQYIATLNTDDLDKAAGSLVVLGEHVRQNNSGSSASNAWRVHASGPH
jgi:uncharacterized protein YydD (DUF2326 family)